MTTFQTLGLSHILLDALDAQGISAPTPIQAQAIPHMMAGRDVMGLAQTGTGKTAAFGLPLVHRLIKSGVKAAPKTASALILAPTRELAKQIHETLAEYTRRTPLKVGVAVGGTSLNAQITRLARGTDILIATPGRLMDLTDRRALNLSETRVLVLDEADQMLDMGFIHALRKIAAMLPKERQTLLFSATMPAQMSELAAAYLNDPVRIEVSPAGKAADKVTQSVHFVAQGDKRALLERMLGAHKGDRALVFCRTKHGAERLMKQLTAAGFAAGSIHGNKSQGQRDRALLGFKTGSCKVLVATDVAARGIDIPGVEFVYNFDLPNVPENYIHRIGRTARAGAEGQAVSFCSADEADAMRDIEKTMKLTIPVAGGTPWARPAKAPRRLGPAKKQQQRRRGRGGRSSGTRIAA